MKGINDNMAHKVRRYDGISLISLIITIVVIIILAAIVIFNGLNTPNSANFAKFTQQVDNVQMAVTNKYAELRTRHALANNTRTDEQIYLEIATGSDNGIDNYMCTVGTSYKAKASESTGIQNILVGEGSGTTATGAKNTEHSIGMTLPLVRESNTGWYVTKEGRVFNANGYEYDGKTYFAGGIYQDGTLPANETSNANRAKVIYETIARGTNIVTGAPEIGSGDVLAGGNSSSEGNGEGENNGNNETPTPTPAGLTATINGETVSITSSNFKDYLGKVVTNFKNTRTGTETVNGKTVSKQYRLYWIDYAGTYGEVGTVYLKADYPGSTTALSNNQDTDASIIMKFNKQLGESDITAKASNNNMKAVTWLLDSDNWASITTTDIHTDMTGKVLKAYGAPSLEMFMDSYNAYYENKGVLNATPDNVSGRGTDATDRIRLACNYATGNYGYKVKPGSSSDWQKNTGNATVQADSDIGTMYYPGGDSSYYWLSSPASNGAGSVIHVRSDRGAGCFPMSITPATRFAL